MTPPKDDDIVEIDAMDEAEWERDQHTPVASDQKLEELVRQTAKTPPSAVRAATEGAPKATFARTTTRSVPAAAPPPTPPASNRASTSATDPKWSRAETSPANPADLDKASTSAKLASVKAPAKARTTTGAVAIPPRAPTAAPAAPRPTTSRVATISEKSGPTATVLRRNRIATRPAPRSKTRSE